MHSLRFGDCLVELGGLEEDSVDFIFTDLPYGTTKCSWDTPINLPLLWEQYWRVLKDDGCIAMFAQSPFDKYLSMSQIQWYRYEWIWEKTSATGHFNARRMPMKAHENILIFYKTLPYYNPQMTSGHKRKTALAHHKRKCKDSDVYNKGTDPIDYDSTERFPRDVLRFATDKQKGGKIPSQKPVKLCEYIINTYTRPGEVVLDSCMGSGTTGVACTNTGRGFIGMDNDYENFHIALRRIGAINVEYRNPIVC